jgi:hypothetical protein
MVTLCTTRLKIKKFLHSAHTVYLCVLYGSQQTAIISLYNIN